MSSMASDAGRRLHGWRIPFLVMAVGSLVTGMWGGLLKLGWGLPLPHANWISYHGPVMVSGFLGTLIALERAVGTRLRWAYLAPLLSGLATFSLLAGLPLRTAGPGLVLAAGLLLVLQVWLTLRYRQFYQGVLAAGVACWLVGNLFWVNQASVHEVVLWWAAFLILTIAGERLELNRFLPRHPFVRVSFVASTGLFIAGVGWSTAAGEAGSLLAGVGLILVSAWLIRNDIARRTVKSSELTRYIAICLLSGYVWLAGAGALLVVVGPQEYGLLYDAFLHAVFLGFVFMMIFGHAPVIFPSVIGLEFRWSPRLYVHVILLHGTLALRVASDLFIWPEVRSWAGLLNTAAILIFLGNMVSSMRMREARPAPPSPRSETERLETTPLEGTGGIHG